MAQARDEGLGELEIQLDELNAIFATEAAASTAPKYATLQRVLEKCIRSGRFKPGMRVPTEAELTRKLEVSLGTIQRALNELVQRGLIVRSRRTGTFVAERFQTSETHVYRFRDPETGAFLLPFTRVLRVRPDATPGPWQDAFNKKRLIRIDRLVWVANDPPAFSSVYMTVTHGRHLLKQSVEQLHGSSWHRLLDQRFRLPTLRMQHSFTCQPLSSFACKHLKLSKATLGTVWDIRDYTFEDQPVLFQRYQLPPGHRSIELEERTTRGPNVDNWARASASENSVERSTK